MANDDRLPKDEILGGLYEWAVERYGKSKVRVDDIDPDRGDVPPVEVECLTIDLPKKDDIFLWQVTISLNGDLVRADNQEFDLADPALFDKIGALIDKLGKHKGPSHRQRHAKSDPQ